jgi:hypothetical protein
MKKAKIIIEFDERKLIAIRQFSKEPIEKILAENIERIYAKCVPKAVQEYLGGQDNLGDKRKQVKGAGL